jgi:hypothetical protein
MREIIYGLVILMVFVFVGISMAQQKPALAKPEGTMAPPQKMEKFRGIIGNVDEAAKSVEVKGKYMKKEQALTFAIDDKTKIRKAGKEVSFAELKKGAHVKVEYKKEGEQMIATMIEETVLKSIPRRGKPAEKQM